jgi:hypothetical protein
LEFVAAVKLRSTAFLTSSFFDGIPRERCFRRSQSGWRVVAIDRDEDALSLTESQRAGIAELFDSSIAIKIILLGKSGIKSRVLIPEIRFSRAYSINWSGLR